MGEFHGGGKKRSSFEGWYYKHQNREDTISFIAGAGCDPEGNRTAFLQVITDSASCHIPFRFSEFHFCPRDGGVRLGQQMFGPRGIRVDLDTKAIRCRGWLRYGPLTPPESDVMGPFRFVPFLECSHGVLSMKHSLTGSLEINGRQVDFGGGTGYMEKDWGSSFPKRYLWVQCNRFPESTVSVMASIADVPFAGLSFRGCIALVRYRGREYRFATYRGVQIVRCGRSGFVVKQGNLVLEAEIMGKGAARKLLAPCMGAMLRTIRESVSCRARFRFYRDGKLLFDQTSDQAGFEYVV
ncbi:MAG: hypothetical protein GX424_05280 [Clostridiales bacterium]|jgi:hypothetical protein|nr:hypothetical protein [Clostridiales bacterium]